MQKSLAKLGRFVYIMKMNEHSLICFSRNVVKNFSLPILFILFFIFSAAGQEKTFDNSVLTEKSKEAFKTLLEIERFGFGGTGPGGDISAGEWALADLVKDKKAIPALIYLVENAKPEGALYALYGLRVLKCKEFNEAFEKFVNLPELPERVLEEFETANMGTIRSAIPASEVQMWEGGVINSFKRLKIASDLKAGKFDELTVIKKKNKCKG